MSHQDFFEHYLYGPKIRLKMIQVSGLITVKEHEEIVEKLEAEIKRLRTLLAKK